MKKAQVQMIETITVLVVFFIIFFIGLYVYYTYTYENIESTAEVFKESEFSTLLYSIASKPEFSCKKGNCIDIAKLEALKQLNYQFLRKKLKIEVIYPEVSEPEVLMWEFPSKFTSEDDIKIINLPISLYYPEKDEFKIGRITLTLYS